MFRRLFAIPIFFSRSPHVDKISWQGGREDRFFFKVAVRRRNFLRHRRNKFPKDTRTLLRFCEGQYWEDLEFLEGHIRLPCRHFFFWGSWRTRLSTSIFFLGGWQSSDLPNGRGLVWKLNVIDLSVNRNADCIADWDSDCRMQTSRDKMHCRQQTT